MPWLQRDKVLFVHIPRCGGTSICKHHKVPVKAREGMNIYYNLWMRYYYYRYGLLDSHNFPFFTIENFCVLLQIITSVALYLTVPDFNRLPVAYVMWTLGTCTFIVSTFIGTAPIGLRNRTLRVCIMYFFGKFLCGAGCSKKYIVGTNENGYLFHLTAENILKYGYANIDEISSCSFSIVRNPFSRVVSLYQFNKRIGESFEHFVRAFHKECKEIYQQQGKTEEYYIYCHVLPMHAYTHDRSGKQLVRNIIKQEEIKSSVAKHWKGSEIPEKIRDALTGIPHVNKRKRKKGWEEFYTKETRDLVVDMYERDFEIFGYSTYLKCCDETEIRIPKENGIEKKASASHVIEKKVSASHDDSEDSTSFSDVSLIETTSKSIKSKNTAIHPGSLEIVIPN